MNTLEKLTAAIVLSSSIMFPSSANAQGRLIKQAPPAGYYLCPDCGNYHKYVNQDQTQNRQIRQEDIFGNYDEFSDALINKKQGNSYLKKLEYVYNNPGIAIQLFDKNRKEKYDSIKSLYYSPPKVFRSFGEIIGENFASAMRASTGRDGFGSYVASAFALKEELGVKFRISQRNPNESELVSMAILSNDYSYLLLGKIHSTQEMKDIDKKISERSKEIGNMGFENFKNYYPNFRKSPFSRIPPPAIIPAPPAPAPSLPVAPKADPSS